MAVSWLTVWAVFFLSLITHTTGHYCPNPPCILWASSTSINKREFYLGSSGIVWSHTKKLLDQSGSSLRALAVDVANDMIYWSDNTRYTISRQRMDNSSAEQIIHNFNVQSEVNFLAVEWVSGLLYWSDSTRNLIEVSKLDGTSRKVLFNTDLKKVYGIAVAPHQGYLFWTVEDNNYNTKGTRIERSSLNGESRTTIKSWIRTSWGSSYYRLRGLAADQTATKLYFADYGSSYLYSCSFSGGNLKTYGLGYSYSFGVGYYKGLTMISKSSYMYTANMTSLTYSRFSLSYSAYGIAVYDGSVQPNGTDPCGNNNGGCNYLCLPKPSGYTCACPTGVPLTNNTCDFNRKKFLLFGDSSYNYFYKLSLLTSDASREVLPLNYNISYVQALHYDPVDDMIYWANYYGGIYRSSIKESKTEQIHEPDKKYITGLTLDYISRLLFWTGNKKIEVSKLDGSKNIIIASGTYVMDIEVHMKKKLIFWSGKYSSAKIWKANMDGSEAISIVNSSLYYPTSLAVDYKNNKIYWIDNSYNKIEGCDLDGSNREQILYKSSMTPKGLDTDGVYVYWSDYYAHNIQKVEISSGSSSVISSGFTYPTDVYLYDSSALHNVSDSCALNNGGCEYLCIPTETGNRCACSNGKIFHTGQKKCVKVKSMLVTDYYKGIYKIYLAGSFSHNLLPVSAYSSTSVSYDPEESRVYFSTGRYIYRAKIDSTQREMIYKDKEYDYVYHVKVDPVGRHLYWMTSKRITMGKLGSNITKTIFYDHSQKIHTIDLDLTNRYIYWYSSGTNSAIRRMKLDGTSGETLTKTNSTYRLTSVNSIAFDYVGQSYYWHTWNDRRYIYGCNFNGSLECIKMYHGLGYRTFYSMALDGDYLYFVDNSYDNVYRFNLKAKTYLLVADYMSYPKSLYIIDNVNDNRTNPCASMNCSELCLWSLQKSKCSCQDGWFLSENNKTCQKDSEEHLLFLTVQNYLYKVSLKGDTYVLNKLQTYWSQSLGSITYDPFTDHLIWTAYSYKYIYKPSIGYTYTLVGSIKTVHRLANSSYSDYSLLSETNLQSYGISIDWSARNIYWTNHNKDTIEVLNLNTSNRVSLLSAFDGVESPLAIKLDLADGLLFWSQGSSNTSGKILRANMDGSDVKELVINSIKQPFQLAVDIKHKKLYWTDAMLGTISSINYDGTNQSVVINSDSFGKSMMPRGLAIDGDFLYWTDSQTEALHRVNLKSKAFEDLISGLQVSMAIHVYNKKALQTVTNPCKNNGGCSYLCLRKPQGHTCTCPVWYSLQDDNKTCVERDLNAVMIVGFTDVLQLYSLDSWSNYKAYNGFNFSETFDPVAIDYDPVDKMIYMIDRSNFIISRKTFNLSSTDTNSSELIACNLENANALAIDWIGRKMYWTNGNKSMIEVSELNGTNRKMLVDTGTGKPNAIRVDPLRGYMFWASEITYWTIERAFMDGTSRSSIATTDLSWPQGLALDYEKQKIYWGDSYNKVIKEANYDGSSQRNVLSLEGGSNTMKGLSFIRGFLYFGDKNASIVYRVSVKNSSISQQVAALTEKDAIFGVHEITNKHPGYNPCSQNNCSHLCLLVPGNKSKCACPAGVKMKEDGRTCDSDNIANEQYKMFLMVAYTSYGYRQTKFISLGNKSLPCLENSLNTSNYYRAVGFDPRDKKLYWYDSNKFIIASSYLNGSDYKISVPRSVINNVYPYAIAIDWISRNIYWTYYNYYGKIMVTNMNGEFKQTLYNYIRYPMQIVLDPIRGSLYYIYSYKRRIGKASMDGSSSSLIAYTSYYYHGLTIDLKNDILYWSNIRYSSYYYSYIESYNLKTNTKGTIHSFKYYSYSYNYHLAFANDSVLWASKTNTIQKLDLEQLTLTNVTARFYGINELHVFGTSMQQDGTNYCANNNGNCSDLCTPKPGGGVCKCASGDYLKSDSKTCYNSCPRKSPVTNGYFINFNGTKRSSTSTIGCYPGFILIGVSNIKCLYTGAWERNKQTCKDNIKPTIKCPLNISVNNDKGKAQATVSWDPPQAYDSSGDIPTTTVYQPSGLTSPAQLNIGKHTIKYVTTDSAGNNATCQFTVTVKDITPPNITCPRNKTVGNDIGKNTAYTTWTSPQTSDNSGVPPILAIYQPASLTNPGTLLIGKTIVVYVATDASGNNATCQFTITVTDTTPPNITCPGDIQVGNDKDASTATVKWNLPLASDNTGEQPTIVLSKPPTLTNPAQLPIGKTTIVYMATDANGNTATCQFTITVRDVTPPKITCPNNITKGNEKRRNIATVQWNLPQATDNSGVKPTVVQFTQPLLTNPAQLLIGSHIVVYMATDAAGNNATCQFTITIKDIEPPEITCIQNYTGYSIHRKNYMIHHWSMPLYKDNNGKATLSYSPNMSSPDMFTIGIHQIKFTAEDDVGLKSHCIWQLTVQDIEKPYAEECTKFQSTIILSESHHTNFSFKKVLFNDNDNINRTTLRINNKIQFNQDMTSTDLLWGENVIEYKAFDISGNSGNCTHYVMVAATTCGTVQTIYDKTKFQNGDLKCESWFIGQECRLDCKEGFDSAVREGNIKYCIEKKLDQLEGNKQKIELNARLPPCTKRTAASKLVLKGTVPFTVYDCRTQVLQTIKEKFETVLKQNIVDKIGHCKTSKQSCKVKNVVNKGCSPNDKKRSRREESPHTLQIEYQLYVSVQDASNASIDKIFTDMKEVSDKTQMNIIVDSHKITQEGSASVQSLGIIGCDEGSVHTSGGFCVLCPPGYMHNTDFDKCKPCPIDTYQDTPGQTTCKPCPDETSTGIADGARDVKSCNTKTIKSAQQGSQEDSNTGLIVGVVLAGIIVLCIVIIAIYVYKRRTATANSFVASSKSTDPIYCMNALYDEGGILEDPLSLEDRGTPATTAATEGQEDASTSPKFVPFTNDT